ncbi:MAG: cyclase family protein [Bryobacterales bacterium]|nr:cyclase family protein [Bryobacterales bacterium]
MSGWMDISVPVAWGMPQWPGDPVFASWKVCELEHGANVTAVSMCAHTGTHVDAPAHYFDGAAGVDEAPLEVLMGRAVVAGLDGNWRGAERVLFRTGNSSGRWWEAPFREDFEALTVGLARELVEGGVKLVGIDYLSVGRNDEEGSEVHRVLLGAGVWILEGLNLCEVGVGEYELVCLPLRLVGADGAPARAVLRSTT